MGLAKSKAASVNEGVLFLGALRNGLEGIFIWFVYRKRMKFINNKKTYILLNMVGVSLCGVRMIEIPLEVSIPQSFTTCLKDVAMTWYQTIKIPATNHLGIS